MKEKSLIVIGDYTPDQIEAFQSHFTPTFLENVNSLYQVDLSYREKIKGLAFKGHKPNEFDTEIFDLLPNLRIISNFGVGYDGINIEEATIRNVMVTNTPDVLNDDVADLAIGMLIALLREFLIGVDWVKTGNWSKFGEMPLNYKVSGRNAGILGLGRIGYEIANRLNSFKMKIHYFSRSKKDVMNNWQYYNDPIELARNVDFLFVSIVGGEKTKKFVNKEILSALGPNGVLINISRGSTIDEEALLKALETKRLRGAALDVFDGEPSINPRFLKLQNVFLQPHQGSGTVETRAAMSKLQRDNLLHYFTDKKVLTPVN